MGPHKRERSPDCQNVRRVKHQRTNDVGDKMYFEGEVEKDADMMWGIFDNDEAMGFSTDGDSDGERDDATSTHLARDEFRPHPYKKIKTLHLYWSAHDIPRNKDEAEGLARVLETEYQAETTVYCMPSNKTERKLMRQLDRLFAPPSRGHEFGSVLYIIHCTCHGGFRDNKMMLAANKQRKSPRLEWTSVQNRILSEGHDTVIIMSTCHAGGSLDISHELIKGIPNFNPRQELLASCGYDAVSYGRFGVALIKALEEKAKEAHQFSIWGLCRDIALRLSKKYSNSKKNRKYYPQPICLPLGLDDGSSIMLRPMRRLQCPKKKSIAVATATSSSLRHVRNYESWSADTGNLDRSRNWASTPDQEEYELSEIDREWLWGID